MCSTPKTPTPSAKLPEAPTPPTASEEMGGRDRDRRRRSSGGSGTILTGSAGVSSPAATQQKTLLGA